VRRLVTGIGRRPVRSRWRRGGVALLALPFLWPVQAGAFEALLDLVRILPATEQWDHSQFDFASPRLQAGWPPRALQGAGIVEFSAALVERGVGVASVGIPFPDLDGLMSFGVPPDTVLYLSGPAVALEAVRPSLLARPGMTEREGGGAGFAVFAIGEEYGIQTMAIDRTYPFGGGYRAHRVAVRDGLAAVTFATPPLEAAIAAAAGDHARTDAWQVEAIIAAAAGLVPDGFEAYAASGLPAEAFLSSSGVPSMPGYAIVVASLGADWEATQFLLSFADPAAADAGAASLAAALVALRAWPEGAKVEVDTAPLPDGAAAVVTVLFAPGTTDHPSSDQLNRWRSDIYARRLVLASPEP